MAKHRSVTSLVALALLACLVGTEVEAQGQGYMIQKGHPPQAPPAPWPPQSPQAPLAHGPPLGPPAQWHPQSPQELPGLWPPESPHELPGQWPLQSPHAPPRPWPIPKIPQMAYDFQQQQNPKIPQKPYISNPIISKRPPPADSCEVERNTRIPCGLPGISLDGCKAINCCFDGEHCYYGKAVTVQCTKDGQFIVVVARDATLPNIDLGSISLLSKAQGCTHVDSNSDFAIYNFPVTSCGTIVLEEPGVIIYENKMFSSYEVETGPRGAITRDSHYELLFQCRYIGTTVQTVVVEVLPLRDPPLPVAALGPIRVELRLGNGHCISKGCNEVDAAYTSSYKEADYPVTKVLRDPVYVEVQLMEKTDPNLVLTLGRCWTTTSPNPHSLPQWDILSDGCPYRNDNYLSSLVPVGPSSGVVLPSHYRRFFFKMFTFVDHTSMQPMREQVYIHCSTAVCTPAAGYSCEPECHRQRRDVMDVDQSRSEPKVVVSVGPVIMGVSAE